MEAEKQTLDRLTQNAVNALNHLIISDELASNYKAIVKISRFKKWLTEVVASGKAPDEITAENVADVLNELEDEDHTERVNNNHKPETIKFD